MKKSIRGWFQELPEPYRTQAINNCNIDKYHDTDQNGVSSLKTALMCGFYWGDSEQGGEYWIDVVKNL